jgi:TrmH family RNA methyltransferase
MLSKTIVKYIQSLAQKKVRDEEGVFIAEGPKVIVEFLTSGRIRCKSIYALRSWFDENENILSSLSAEKIEINEIDLEKISLLKTPNNVLAIFYKLEIKFPVLQNSLSLMLDDIQDPGNMGTIIRTADWFSIKNIICSNGCVDCYNPKVVQATMGSLARISLSYLELSETIKNAGVSVYAAALSGNNIFSHAKIKEGVILIGNESSGISENLLMLAVEKITIPRKGEAESLNAAVACGIILSHLI